MLRPRTLSEVAQRINLTPLAEMTVFSAMSYHLSDFRHGIKNDPEWVRVAIDAEPESVSDVIDVWLAGLAEYLAQRHGLPVPVWTEAPSRFLSETFHLCSKSLFMAGLVKTPEAWMRRKLICEEPEIDSVC